MEKEYRCFDKTGRQIMPCDIIKVFHFIGARNKKHYMYKLVFQQEGWPWISAAHLGMRTENICSLDNSFRLLSGHHDDIEIVEGGGYPDDFESRERHKVINEGSVKKTEAV